MAAERFDADGAPLTVAAVANRLGVAASTLRTWDRRYGLGPSSHQAGSHRRYTPDDVARLETMRRLTLRGVAPADAARIAADEEGGAATPERVESPASRDDDAQLIIDPLTLAAAAVEPDPPRLQRMLARAAAERGIVETWTEVTKPALAMLRQRGRLERPGMDPEGVLEAAMLATVRDVAARTERAQRAHEPASVPRPASVLLYASEESRLRAHVVGAALLEAGVRARIVRGVLGPAAHDGAAAARGEAAAAGTAALLDLVREEGAGALAVLGAPAGAVGLVEAASERGDVEIFLLGTDAPEVWLPRVRRVRTAVAAVHEIAGVLGAEHSP
ncbi:MerR family transcriptional regulator [Georgenia wangjunii]|uniref:MerR family transcriptional regulator n=1 Tax=Georgenia wangjunii TaxID=3117730 RepID=UPI002F26119F